MTAARPGRVEAVELLLEAGADIKAKEPNAGQTALMWAIADGHADVVRRLNRSGRTGTRAVTPAIHAASAGNQILALEKEAKPSGGSEEQDPPYIRFKDREPASSFSRSSAPPSRRTSPPEGGHYEDAT
jgi:ankyrin repeat protein